MTPRYRPEPSATSHGLTSVRATCPKIEAGWSKSASVTSVDRPTTNAFMSVPKPIGSRAQIKPATSARPVSIATVPMVSGVCSETPSSHTTQGP